MRVATLFLKIILAILGLVALLLGYHEFAHRIVGGM
jgi:hypothetical protein